MAPLQRKSSSLSPKSTAIHHPTHPKHPLEAITNETEYSCDGCHTPGVGKRYHCSTCSFDLHEHCAKCPDKLSSYVHPRHALLLENKASIDRFCDICGDLVNGLFYSCEECEIDIHPLCTLFPLNANHDLHPQHVLRLQPGKPGWCGVCREICNFWRYRCNTCCIDVHPNCVSKGLSDLPSNGGGDGSATRGLPPPEPAGDKKAPAACDGGSTIQVVAQQASQPYPPSKYAGEVPTTIDLVMNTRGIPDMQQSATSPVARHGVHTGLHTGASGGFTTQGVPHQAPQAYSMVKYGVDVLNSGGEGVSSPKATPLQSPLFYPTSRYVGGIEGIRGIPQTQSAASPYPPMGYGVDVLTAEGGGNMATQGVPYQAPHSYPMVGYGVSNLATQGVPYQTPQSYPAARNANEVPTADGSSMAWGISQQQQQQVSTGGDSGAWGMSQQQQVQGQAPQAGYGVGLPQGGYPMAMMNPGFPMGMGMMMAQPPTMVIIHQNYPGQGTNFGMNQQQQKGVNQGQNQKKNDDFDELAEVGKAVKKKLQIAGKYAMGLASVASTSLAGAPVNVATFMKK